MSYALEPRVLTVLVAEDDEDDRLLIRDAIHESGIANHLYFVEDGEELMDFLGHKNKYLIPVPSPRPDVIFLDLNMPKMDGRLALRYIKSNPALRGIPIVALTGSKTTEDINRTYDLGVNSFVHKPVLIEDLVKVIRQLAHYWLEVVKLPKRNHLPEAPG